MTKQEKLQRHKNIATGLFVLMLVIYIVMVVLQKRVPELSITGYVKAFAEAAMVGALADWFAVTALFHKPLGLNIPHTNLIEERKRDIGENLGEFVVENFLKPEQIRPYITDIKVSKYVVEWLLKEGTAKQVDSFVRSMSLCAKVSEGFRAFLDEGKHQEVVQQVFERLAIYLGAHKELIQGEVEDQFSSIIPSFIKGKIGKKVSEGLYELVLKASRDKNHPIRVEISAQLYELAGSLNTVVWEERLSGLLKGFMGRIGKEVREDVLLQGRIDAWVRKSVYQFVLRNKEEVGRLISDTVSEWEGRDLSKKLELEVGKDLQFIRINGTLVGGIVGLFIYFLTELF